MKDVIVEPIRRIREELIKRYGGIDGYFKHCQAQERARTRRPRLRRGKQSARTAGRTTKGG
jgi:hypothetical protein